MLIDLTKDDMVALAKHRIAKTIDLRSSNTFGQYSDSYGRFTWRDSFFEDKSEEELEMLLDMYK